MSLPFRTCDGRKRQHDKRRTGAFARNKKIRANHENRRKKRHYNGPGKLREFGARLLVPPKTVSAKLSGLRKLFCDEGQRKAREADVLIINHHLFLADMELNDQDFVDFLPDFDMVIFDEAHQLPSIATSFFSESISMSEVKNFAQDAYVTAARLVPKGDEWKDYQTKIFNRCNDVRLKATILGAEEESKEVFG